LGAAGREILIIDDDAAIRDMLALYLRSQGYATATAGDGAAGVRRCAELRPDLVLCDLRMPGMSGLEVMAKLNADFPELPTIVVSGTGDLGDAIAAIKLGAWDYVTKPIEDFAVLDHAVGRALERARLLAENLAYRRHLETANAQLAATLRQLEEDEESGRRIQFALLPDDRVAFENFECSRFLATSAILGGDFVDYFAIDPDRFGFYMADVSGHGVPSAVITVLLKSYVGRYLDDFRNYGEPTIVDPAALLASLNRQILGGRHGKYLTMFYGVVSLSANRLEFANGGQFPFPLLSDGERVSEIGGRSRPVGLFADARYVNQQLDLPPRFALRLFSDGVLEVLATPDLPGRKAALCALAADLAPDAEALAQRLGIDEDRPLPDDASVFSLRRIRNNA
jgi:serine phosphatase RsbU (regulator of sigma subunit)